MNKNKIVLILILIMVLVFALVACDIGSNPNNDVNNGKDQETDNNINETQQYKIYLMVQESGFTGTYEEWLNSVKGADGKDGKEIELSIENKKIVWRYVGTTEWKEIYSVNDLIGPKGEPGKSAYEMYKEKHPEYTKTEEEWLDDLVNGRLGKEEDNQYIVKFDSKGGSLVPDQIITRLDKVVMPDIPTKEGYNFNGWYIQGEKWLFNVYLVSGDITLEAKWIPKVFEITINYDNNKDPELHILRDYGENINLLPPEKENNIFVGWVDSDGNKVTSSYLITKETTITAIWKNYIEIIFDTDGGNVIPNQKVLLSNMDVTSLPTPIKYDANFLGWYYNDQKIELPFLLQSTNDITLKAHWGVPVDYSFEEQLNGGIKLTAYNGKEEHIVIPNMIAGKKVVGIAPDVFKGKSIVDIEFTGAFENIELSENLFTEMQKLVYVKLPNGLKKIPKGAFRNSSALTHVELPSSLEVIDEFAFQGCSQLIYTTNLENDALEQENKKFYLNNNLIRIEKSAFEGCRAISKLVINDKLEYVGISAFQNAHNLLNVEVSANSLLSTIDDYGFATTRLKSTKNKGEKILFPNLKVIGKGAFANIYSYFEYFELGKNIETIRDEAFLGTTALRTIVYDPEINPTTLGTGIFKDCLNLNAFRSTTSQEIDNNSLPKNLVSVPDLTFSGCINLLSKEDFDIHKDIKEIGKGAFAIYNNKGNSSRQMYTGFKMNVDPENEYFKMVQLENYKVGSTTTPSHYVLMTADEKELIAYFGGYTTYVKSGDEYDDAYRMTDFNGKALEMNSDKYTYSAFTFLHQNADIRNNLTTIRSYAFAGVRFDRIFIPNGVVKICENAFINSDIKVILFNKLDCEFEENTFAGMKQDPMDCLTIATTESGEGRIKIQVNEMISKGLIAEYRTMGLFS